MFIRAVPFVLALALSLAVPQAAAFNHRAPIGDVQECVQQTECSPDQTFDAVGECLANVPGGCAPIFIPECLFDPLSCPIGPAICLIREAPFLVICDG